MELANSEHTIGWYLLNGIKRPVHAAATLANDPKLWVKAMCLVAIGLFYSFLATAAADYYNSQYDFPKFQDDKSLFGTERLGLIADYSFTFAIGLVLFAVLAFIWLYIFSFKDVSRRGVFAFLAMSTAFNVVWETISVPSMLLWGNSFGQWADVFVFVELVLLVIVTAIYAVGALNISYTKAMLLNLASFAIIVFASVLVGFAYAIFDGALLGFMEGFYATA